MKEKTRNRVRKIQSNSLFIAKKIMVIIIGSALIAVAYNSLIIPYNLLTGGVSGIALVGEYVFDFPVYWGILVLSIPVYIWGIWELNYSFLIYSLLGTVTLIVTLPLTRPYLPVPELDIFLASIFSGIVCGVGYGFILKNGISCGGSDIFAVILKKRRNIAVGESTFYFNAFVLALSLFFFDLKIILYTVISLWVCGRVMDTIINGLKRNKSVMIVSEQSDEIAGFIMNELQRGVTYLRGQGAFSGESKLIINCIVNNYQLAKINEFMARVDPDAFMFITEVTDVSGRGFTIQKNS